MTIENVCEILEKKGIGYHKDVRSNGFVFLYIDRGNFGYPIGQKFRKNEFRPYLRLSVHEDHPNEIYTRNTGSTGYMSIDEVLETIRRVV